MSPSNRQLEERQMRKDRILNGALSVFKSKGLDGGDSMVSVMVDKDGKPSSGKNKRGKGKNKDSNNLYLYKFL